ncbi:MAG: phosphoadenosine phosphosulfate reductase [Albidovulum sp.]
MYLIEDAVLKDQGSLSEEEWFARIEDQGAREGYFMRLGRDHAALFVDRSPTLIVTFETASSIRRRMPDQQPLGLATAQTRQWSHLCIITRTESWYRDPAVYAYFDQLVDDAFFEDFENVVFYGAGMAGYAAAAYSVTSPGASVVLLQPQATLDPAMAGWDPRFSESRRLCFTDRYGYAPDMTEGAGSVYVIFDPDQTLDAMHAALFRRPFTTLLPCRHLGSDIAGSLSEMKILPSVLTAAATGSFDEKLFWTFYRARRNHIPYLRKLLSRLETDGRPRLGALLAKNAAERLNDAKFAKRAAELSDQLAP